MSNTIEQQLKEALQCEYKSSDNFIHNIIYPVFGEENYVSDGNNNVFRSHPELKPKAEASGILSIKLMGHLFVEGSELNIFDVTLDYKKQLRNNRVEIQQIIRSIIGTYSGAFIIFHYESGARWEWRFTFCHKGASQQDSTNAQRYTFLLGPDQSCRTAAENFMKIRQKIEREGEFEMDDIIKAFDVEALSKEFFAKYKEQYEKFCQFVYDHKTDETLFGHEFATWEDKTIRDYVKKMLGRIVFLHFLQKKGWMGVPADKPWGEGDRQFMKSLFENATPKQQANYLDEVLEPIFHEALNINRTKENDIFDCKVDGFTNVKIPYLNGGLFEREDIDKPTSVFPAEYFKELFEFFYQYNFTIDENDPNDAQVGVDPEMLGRIFENLLEDNKDKGAFYTPKEIVQYMCRESLIAYLQTDAKDNDHKQRLRDFVTKHDASILQDAEYVRQKIKDVKICDPAIGSGAFPMGLLNELVLCSEALNIHIDNCSNRADVKKHIIQNSIYGVDIEKGAVDIARLRFWLSLIVDEETPHALPNMDFKIMQGNSLLEQYTIDSKHVINLADIIGKHQEYAKQLNEDSPLFAGQKDLDDAMTMDLQQLLKDYYYITNHEEKQQKFKQIEEIVREFIRVEINKTYPKASQNPDRTLAKDAFSKVKLFNSEFFLWHTWFSDVFEKKGGFDIVIGNPPYVEAKKLKHIASTLKPLFNVYSGTADLSIYFVEHGLNLLSEKGILSYITTNKFFNTGYGKPLRKLIISNNVNKMINFEQVEVFEGVLVSSVILEMRKSASIQQEFTYEKFYKLNATQFKEQFVARIGSFGTYPVVELDENEWSFSDVSSLKIKRHIEQGHILLGEVDGVNIYRGVTTGYNPAFIINNEKREELIATDSKNAAVIKNMLQGRNIRKWYYNESDENLVFIPWHFPLHKDETISGASSLAEETLSRQYPFLYKHLLSHKTELEDRNHDETGIRYEWYALQRCAASYYDEFEKPEKIIWGLTADKWAYTLDTEGHYLPSNGYILTSTKIPTKYILGLLNSKLLHYYFGFIGVMTAGGAYTLKAATISALPFVDTNNYEPIITLVDRILSAKKANHQADTTAEELEIDRLVYQLYGLTEEEIAIVEGK